MTALEARSVVAGYGGATVLHGCDLRVNGGEVVCVVGPNGAGKSTLLRVLAGLLRPRTGGVFVDDIDVATLTRSKLARRIAVVPQLLETLFPFAVREIVALGRTSRLGLLGGISDRDTAVIGEALAAMELEGLADRRIDTLSGGERQRTVLAMALAQEADVLLLDEPTTHLDLAHQVAILERVRDLARERKIVCVAVLHDLNLAAAFATRVVIVDGGRIIDDGSPEAVLTQSSLVAVFGDRLRVLAGSPPVVLPRPAQIR